MDPPQYPIKGVDTKLAIHSETVNIEPCCEYMYYNCICSCFEC